MSYLEDLDSLTDGQSFTTILTKAQSLLSNEDLWCAGAHALDAERHKVRANDPKAIAWSLEGAVALVSNQYGIAPPAILKLLDLAICRMLSVEDPGILNTHDAGWFNDSVDHQDIIAVLELAKEMASEGGGML